MSNRDIRHAGAETGRMKVRHAPARDGGGKFVAGAPGISPGRPKKKVFKHPTNERVIRTWAAGPIRMFELPSSRIPDGLKDDFQTWCWFRVNETLNGMLNLGMFTQAWRTWFEGRLIAIYRDGTEPEPGFLGGASKTKVSHLPQGWVSFHLALGVSVQNNRYYASSDWSEDDPPVPYDEPTSRVAKSERRGRLAS